MESDRRGFIGKAVAVIAAGATAVTVKAEDLKPLAEKAREGVLVPVLTLQQAFSADDRDAAVRFVEMFISHDGPVGVVLMPGMKFEVFPRTAEHLMLA
jgi:hypothetical protein